MARIVGVMAILLVLVALTNLVYHVVRKPTELFFRWRCARQGAGRDVAAIRAAVPRVFHRTITPELLAALAQVESTAIRWRAPTGAGG